MSPKDDKARKASIGFDGGQVLPLRLPQSALDTLRTALQDDEGGFLDIEIVDGSVLLDTRQVVFLRVDSDEQRIGF